MNLKLYRNKPLTAHTSSDQGFSLIETVIALTTLGVCLAYAMPLFLYAKINNSKSEIRTGALIVSQRVFDNIRSRPIATAPLTDGRVRDPNPATDWITQRGTQWVTSGNADETNPIVQPKNMDSVLDPEKLFTYAMGRQYRTKITYCQDVSTDPSVCSPNYRKFKVEVSYNGSKVYDLEGTYTEFQ
jgi:prepilin-type N-terminal cleavage/methylation domain-containing protein